MPFINLPEINKTVECRLIVAFDRTVIADIGDVCINCGKYVSPDCAPAFTSYKFLPEIPAVASAATLEVGGRLCEDCQKQDSPTST